MDKFKRVVESILTAEDEELEGTIAALVQKTLDNGVVTARDKYPEAVEHLRECFGCCMGAAELLAILWMDALEILEEPVRAGGTPVNRRSSFFVYYFVSFSADDNKFAENVLGLLYCWGFYTMVES